MDEIWKPVHSKPGIYASNLGRIKLPERVAKMPNGGIRIYAPKPTFGTKAKASKNALHSYMNISNRFFGNIKVHRMVCEAFHGPAPIDRPIVIHLNENGTDNRAENLRWGTQKENLNMPGFVAYCRSRTGKNSPVVKGRKK
jgi:hypothetical protein